MNLFKRFYYSWHNHLKSRLWCELCGRVHLVSSPTLTPLCSVTQQALINNSYLSDFATQRQIDWLLTGTEFEKNKARLGLRQEVLKIKESEMDGAELFGL